jgi:hypothetical protein
MAPNGANPAFLGMRSGKDGMKLVMVVTLHQRKGGATLCCQQRHETKEGQQSTAARQVLIHVCLVGGYTINNDQER